MKLRQILLVWALALLAALLFLGGCSTVAPQQGSAEPSEEALEGSVADPWEPFNRAMFKFNQDLDAGLIYPWTSAYVTLVPPLLRKGVTNFFNNASKILFIFCYFFLQI